MSVLSLNSILEGLPSFESNEIIKSFIKGYNLVNNRYNNIVCSISGGSDSDIMLDIIHRIDEQHKVRYVWFDTGIEYQATKNHLNYLEQRYGIAIERIKAIKPIPLCVKEYGQPFISKMVSGAIYSLQKNNFKFENKSYDELIKEYPKCKSLIKWWCNEYPYTNSVYNINYNKYLKEFLIKYPPTFKISSKCCEYAKKKVSKQLIKDIECDLMITGIRKAEGGIRSARYKSCYSYNDTQASYRPLFWFTDTDKQLYEKTFNISHSDCYTVYGFKRTGCVGCPYNRLLETDLQAVERYEPKLYKAVNNIFKDSYEYTKQYRQFVKEMKAKDKLKKTGQLSLFNLFDINLIEKG